MTARPVPRAACLFVLVSLAAPGIARAQHAQYHYPVERAAPESHVELQFEYAQPGSDPTVHRTVLSVEGQVAIAGRLELALDVPFLFYSFTSSDEPTPIVLTDAQVGDFILGVKGKLWDNERWTVSAFVDALLPIHSGLQHRTYSTLQMGAAAGWVVSRLELGGTLEGLWFVRTSDEEGEQAPSDRDVAYIGFSVHAAYSVWKVLAARLAVQFYNSVHPGGEIQIVGLTPGIELRPVERLYLGLACRIAPTEDSKLLLGGRAALQFSTGYRF
jgi:hypothetical protein